MERAQLKGLVRTTGVAQHRGEFAFLVDPQLARGARELGAGHPEANGPVGEAWLCIATGGSGGGVKFARHDERTIGAAVLGFCAHFGLPQVNAVDVLPPYHVSGFMARARCAATGGEHLAWEWSRLQRGERPSLRPGVDWIISLVPTQLQRLLHREQGVEWLRQFRIILIGGGPVWPRLADDAAAARLQLSLSYGMTETGAMVTALRPEEFLSGARSSGRALPHARVTVDREDRIRVTGESVFRGYFPGYSDAREFATEDLGRIDDRQHLHVLGRRDAMIITGGEKVHPAQVEATLRASGEFEDVAVIGVPDAEWGEKVVACYPAQAREGRLPDCARAAEALPGFQRPKAFIPLDPWPRNAQGKVNRAALRDAVMRLA